MAGDLEDLVLSISADTRQIMRALNKLQGDTNKTTKQIERQFNTMGDRVGRSFAGIGRGMAASLAGAFSLRGAQQLIDSATRIENALKVAGLAGDELTKVYDRLFASAQKNAAPLESLVTLYGRAALVQKELGISTDELLGFTDKVAIALRVSGKSAQESSGALLQLSQALGSGVVRAEEFNSILEGALPIAQAAAAGLEEAGGSVAKLRALVVDGKVSSEAFFRAFEAGSVILNEKVANAEFTVAQAFTRLQNTLVNAAGKFDEVTGASAETVRGLDRGAGIVNGLSNVFEAAANGPIGTYIGRLHQLNELLKSILPGIGAIGLLTEENLNGLADFIGPAAGPGTVPTTGGKAGRVYTDPVQARIDAAFGETNEVNTVSLKNFAVPSSGKDKKGGGGKRSRDNDYEREIEHIQRRTAALTAEAAALSTVNPLVEDYGYQLEKAKAEHELLTAAQEAGVKITPELRAQIEALAHQYATAAVEVEKLAEAHDKMVDSMEFREDLLKDAMSGFRSALRDGKLEMQELGDIAMNVLDKIISKIEDELIDAIFKLGNSGGGGGGGILGWLFGGFGGGFKPNTTAGAFFGAFGAPGFAKGTNSAPGGLAWVGEEGPELMNVPKGAQILPSDLSRKIAASAGGGTNVTVANSFTMDLRGAQPGVGAEVEAAIKKATNNMTPAVVKALKEIKRQGIRV